jgi:ATP-binding cassette subfamily F protein uup
MKNPNFLILDEPTNDLDILTLNVLEEYLAGFMGCVIIVSHDRYFMDKVVDHIFEFQGNGKMRDFPGNYTQLREKQEDETKDASNLKNQKPTLRNVSDNQLVKKEKKAGLSYKEKKEFEALTSEIQIMEEEKNLIEQEMSLGSLSPQELYTKSKKHGDLVSSLDEKEMRWLELSEK